MRRRRDGRPLQANIRIRLVGIKVVKVVVVGDLEGMASRDIKDKVGMGMRSIRVVMEAMCRIIRVMRESRGMGGLANVMDCEVRVVFVRDEKQE